MHPNPLVGRLFNATDAPAGLALCIDAFTVLTAAHVIDGESPIKKTADALSGRVELTAMMGTTLRRFSRFASVIEWGPAQGAGLANDIALLALEEALPSSVAAATIDIVDGTVGSGTPLIMGTIVPDGSRVQWVDCVVAGTAQDGLIQVRSSRSAFKKGYSGAPIFTADSGRFVGVFVALLEDATQTVGWAVPAWRMHALWPARFAHRSPYVGLAAFDKKDAEVFFGRDAEQRSALELLEAKRGVVIVGPSGSGKTSLIRAGILPALEDVGTLTMQVLPGEDPVRALALSISRALSADRRVRVSEIESWERATRLDPVKAIHLAREAAASGRAILIIDQFEELITRSPPKDRAVILDALSRARALTDVNIVLGVRDDYYGRFLTLDQKTDKLLTECHLALRPLSRRAIVEAIVAPAARVGVTYEAGLVEKMAAEVLGQPGSLPLLQFTLDLLWRQRTDQEIKGIAYLEIGSVGGAIATQVERALAEVSDEDQAIVRDVFLRLVVPGSLDAKKAVARPDFSEAEWRVAQHLVDRRILVSSVDEVSAEETISVPHEALLRSSPVIRAWIRDSEELLQIEEEMRSRLRDWELGGYRNEDLLSGRALARGVRLLEDAPLKSARYGTFIAQSRLARDVDSSRALLRLASDHGGLGPSVPAALQPLLDSPADGKFDRRRVTIPELATTHESLRLQRSTRFAGLTDEVALLIEGSNGVAVNLAQRSRQFEVGVESPVTAVNVEPQSELAFLGLQSGKVVVLDSRRNLTHELVDLGARITCLARWEDRGDLIVWVGQEDGRLVGVRSSSGERVVSYKATSWINCIACDTGVVFVAGRDGTLTHVTPDLRSGGCAGELLSAPSTDGSWLTSVVIAGDRLVTSSWNGKVFLLDRDGVILRESFHEGGAWGASYIDVTGELLSWGRDGNFIVLDSDEVEVWRAHAAGPIVDVAIDGSLRLAAIASDDNTVRLHRLVNGDMMHAVVSTARVRACRFRGDDVLDVVDAGGYLNSYIVGPDQLLG